MAFQIFESSHPELESLSEDNVRWYEETIAQLCELNPGACGLSEFDYDSYRGRLETMEGCPGFSAIHELLVDYRADVIKNKRLLQWQVQAFSECYAVLGRQASWEAMLVRVQDDIARTRINALRSMWERSGGLLFFSSNTLRYFAEAVLPALQEYLNFAWLELESKRNRISQEFYERYRVYLVGLRANLELFQSHVVHAMLASLQKASESGDLKNDDALYEILQQLQTLSVLPDGLAIPRERRGLTEDNLAYCHHYVEAHRETHLNASECYKLDHMQWVSDSQLFCKVIYKHRRVVILQTMASMVPTPHKFWDVVNPGRYSVARYFSRRFSLMLHLRQLSEFRLQSVELEAGRGGEQWQELCRYSGMITREAATLDGLKPRGWLARFQKRKRLMHTRWTEGLDQFKREVVCHKIRYVQALVAQLRGIDFIEDLGPQWINAIVNVQQMVHVIAQECNAWGMRDSYGPEIEVLEGSLRYFVCFQCLFALGEGDFSSIDQIGPLVTFYQAFSRDSHASFIAFQHVNSWLFEKLYFQWETALSERIEVNVLQLHALTRLLVTLADNVILSQFHARLNELFLLYLREGVREGFEERAVWFAGVESILCEYAEEGLRTKMHFLRDARANMPTAVFQSLCEASIPKQKSKRIRKDIAKTIEILDQKIIALLSLSFAYTESDVTRFYYLRNFMAARAICSLPEMPASSEKHTLELLKIKHPFVFAMLQLSVHAEMIKSLAQRAEVGEVSGAFQIFSEHKARVFSVLRDGVQLTVRGEPDRMLSASLP